MEKFFFNNLFCEEVDEVTRGSLWDEGMIRVARSMRTYMKPKCTLRDRLPEVCARIDDILTAKGATEAVVKDAFADYLDHATFKRIGDQYPTHQRETTRNKISLNWVISEVCNTEIWKWNQKNNKLEWQ